VARTINQIADSLRAIRLVLEPVTLTGFAVGNSPFPPSLGVSVYQSPATIGTDAGPCWYRVLGPVDKIDGESCVFIFAILPDPTPYPTLGLDNTGYVDFDEAAEISFVQFAWGNNVFVNWPKPPKHSTLTVNNNTLVDLWLIWTGDAHAKDFVHNGGNSTHSGGSIVSANFLISVYKNAHGSVGTYVGDAAVNVHGADAGELVVRNNTCFLITATQTIEIGALIIGEMS
jgi:hypothetical protein